MIIIEHGDMFTNKKVNVLVNPINCVGVMGKGLALDFKIRYPDMFEDYSKRCRNYEVKIGEPYLYIDSSGQKIINFPTKRNWKDSSYITDIEKGLDYLIGKLDEWEIDNIGMPALGCGLGGLEWETVYSLLEDKLSSLKQTFYVYAIVRKNAAVCLNHYTGVGARETPPDVLKIITDLASELSNKYTLRSGGADGADTAFYIGSGKKNCDIYLPWPGFNGAPRETDFCFIDHYPDVLIDKATGILTELITYFPNMKQAVQKLFIRNVFQVLGNDLNSPSKFLICWTENGELKGGTRIAILLANKFNVPVFNLANPSALKELRGFLENDRKQN